MNQGHPDVSANRWPLRERLETYKSWAAHVPRLAVQRSASGSQKRIPWSRRGNGPTLHQSSVPPRSEGEKISDCFLRVHRWCDSLTALLNAYVIFRDKGRIPWIIFRICLPPRPTGPCHSPPIPLHLRFLTKKNIFRWTPSRTKMHLICSPLFSAIQWDKLLTAKIKQFLRLEV